MTTHKRRSMACRILLIHVFATIFLSGGLYAQAAHRALRKGEQAYDAGDYIKAQEAYSEVNNYQGKFNAGNAAMHQNELEAASTYFQAAINESRTVSQKADAYFNLGNALLLQKKYTEAINAYENSLRISPKQADAQKNLQIAKRQLIPPPPISPPPPPPPSSNPRRYYVDQAKPPTRKELPLGDIPPAAARKMLKDAILLEEEKNAQAYRALAPSNKASRLKKDW